MVAKEDRDIVGKVDARTVRDFDAEVGKVTGAGFSKVVRI